MNQEVAEGKVSVEYGKGWVWEDVTSDLELAEMSENDVVDTEVGGLKGEDQGNYPCSIWGEGEQEQNYGTQRCG